MYILYRYIDIHIYMYICTYIYTYIYIPPTLCPDGGEPQKVAHQQDAMVVAMVPKPFIMFDALRAKLLAIL